ncbi:MAG: DVUA0089 family protein [Methylomonas sp.]
MKYRSMLGTIALLVCTAQPAAAVDFSYTGAFSQDDNVQFISFSIGATSSVTIETLSYDGGVNAAGQTIAAGGFVPFLQLFAADGSELNGAQAQSSDASFTESLSAGSYLLALTENNNVALGDLIGGVPNPADFSEYGQGNFTGVQFGNDPNNPQPFTAPDGSQRDANWAVDILNVDNSAIISSVPETGLPALFSFGLVLMGMQLRRRAI